MTLARLNWTKIGLKRGAGADETWNRSCLNWTKIGLKRGRVQVAPLLLHAFELD